MIDGLPEVSFHDAEVVSLLLDRAGPTLELRVAVVFPEQRTVRLRFGSITEVELDGFNEQNVLFDLKVTRTDDGLFDVELDSTHGVGGSFRCESVASE